MDIYGLINSQAISEHCRKIAYQFTPLEMAYLVYANTSLTITKKHAAFRKIIAEQPDIEVAERLWTPHFDSLHGFLKVYMELQTKYLDIFYKDERSCVYSFTVWYTGDENYTEDDKIYSTFASCYKAIMTDIDEMMNFYKNGDENFRPLGIRVKKQWLNGEGDEFAKHLTIGINQDNQPMDIWDDCSIIASEDRDILTAFEGLWPEIPTPFQRGDILINRSWRNNDEKPFVLDWIPYWEDDEHHAKIVSRLRETGDQSDLITSIYGQDEDGSTWCDHGPSYLDLEYCDKELYGTERFLIALSNYLKGDLPLELLYRSYDILKAEQYAEKQRHLISGFYGDLLVKAGLKK